LRFTSCEAKTGDGESDRKRAARQALTLGAVDVYTNRGASLIS
jgi:hypothetical protein